MFRSRDRLVILDVDGTLVDAFHAIDIAFARNGMDLGNLERFQKRRRLFKYLGGLKELPGNLRKQFGKQSRSRLRDTLTEVYREEARLFSGMAGLLRKLLDADGIRVGLVTRNVTRDPEATLKLLFARHGIDGERFDFLRCLPLDGDKGEAMAEATQQLGINPSRGIACGDEHRDYLAALHAGLNPLIAAYGFESHERLSAAFGVPASVIVDSPDAMAARLAHSLDLAFPARKSGGGRSKR